MSDTLLTFYHYLPAPLRSVAASIRGLSLRSWRYGPETERQIAGALEREYWSSEQWKAWQENRLAYILHRAATQVPYYREQWMARRRRGDHLSWEYIENWPVLEKESLRQYPRAFVADDRDVRRMYHDSTAGTTGTPLQLWLSKQVVRAWFALFEARARQWNGVSRHDAWATLGGQPIVCAHTQHPPFWVWNAPLNQLYMSANHISHRNAPDYIAALARYHVTHMLAYSSSASILARRALDLGLRVPRLKAVITIAEPLNPWQRDLLRQGFGCEIRESYGMGEIVAAATECPAGMLHLWPEVGWLEVLNDAEDVPLPRGTSGRLVCTSLLNVDMPLVRYAVGDRGRSAAEDIVCACGRTLPIISAIEGRVNDLLVALDGRRIYWLNPIFYGLPIREAQIIQEMPDQVRIYYVPAPAFRSNAASLISERLKARMGEVNVILERVNEIPRAANGKFRAVICQVSPHQRGSKTEPSSSPVAGIRS